MIYYTCCHCGFECRNKVGPCRTCIESVFTSYNGEYCGCRGNWLLGGSAFTSYECKVCGRNEVESNTNVPKVCRMCAKSQQCVYCGRKKANYIYSIRRDRFRKFYEKIKNKIRDKNEPILNSKDRTTMTEEYKKETEEIINKFYKPL